MVEVGDFFPKDEVLEQDRPARVCLQGILVVGDGETMVGGQLWMRAAAGLVQFITVAEGRFRFGTGGCSARVARGSFAHGVGAPVFRSANRHGGYRPSERLPRDCRTLPPTRQSRLRAGPFRQLTLINRRGGNLSAGNSDSAIACALVARVDAPDHRRANRKHPAERHQRHRPRMIRMLADCGIALAGRWRLCWPSSFTAPSRNLPTSTS